MGRGIGYRIVNQTGHKPQQVVTFSEGSRLVEVPVDVFERAQARADQRGERLGDVVARALENYLAGQ